MRRMVSIFLGGFLLDAALSVADGVGGIPGLASARNVVAWAMVLFGLGLYGAMAFVPALPKRVLLPAVAFLVWASVCGGFPLVFVAPAAVGWLLPAGQLVLAAGLLAVHARRRPGPPPLPRGFSWGNLAAFVLLTAVAVPLVVSVAVVNAAGLGVEAATNGYVKLRPAGVMLDERVFERDGRSVRLVGMMHIGDANFYRQVFDALPGSGRSVVLLEGVSDEKGLLRSHFSYAKIAALLGLASQESSALQGEGAGLRGRKSGGTRDDGRGVAYRSADVDVATFDPLTIDFIGAVGTLLASPSLEVAIGLLRDPASPFNQPGAEKAVQSDLMDRRNAHLLEQIDRAVADYRTVVVPWGAMHLPVIEEALRRRGFRETRRVSRPVVAFR